MENLKKSAVMMNNIIDVKNIECSHIKEWDYKGLVDTGMSQSDWNHTIHTRVIQISSLINRDIMLSGADTIILHPSMCHLIEACGATQLHNRFSIIFDDTIDSMTIYVINAHLYNSVPQIPLITPPLNSGSFYEIEFIPTTDLSESDLAAYKKKLCGCIKIKNYE